MILGIIESFGTHLKMGIRLLYAQVWLKLILCFNSDTLAICLDKWSKEIEEDYGTPAPDRLPVKVVFCRAMVIIAFVLLALTLLLEVAIRLVSLAYTELVYG